MWIFTIPGCWTKEDKGVTDLQKVRKVTVYLASRNSTGIHECVLRVRGDGYILGEGDSHYIPSSHMSRLGKPGDWRVEHMFETREAAIADYIALEKARIKTAKAALVKIAA